MTRWRPSDRDDVRESLVSRSMRKTTNTAGGIRGSGGDPDVASVPRRRHISEQAISSAQRHRSVMVTRLFEENPIARPA